MVIVTYKVPIVVVFEDETNFYRIYISRRDGKYKIKFIKILLVVCSRVLQR